MNTLASYGLLLVLVLAPFGLGLDDTVTRSFVLLLLAISVSMAGMTSWSKIATIHFPPGLTILAAIFFLLILQLVPLPLPVVQYLSSVSFEVYSPVFEAQDVSEWTRVSLVPKSTFHHCIVISGSFLFYVAIVHLFKNPFYLIRCVWVAVAVAFLLSLQIIVEVVMAAQSFSNLVSLQEGSDLANLTQQYNDWIGIMVATFPLASGLFLFYRPVVDQKTSSVKRVSIPILITGLWRPFSLIVMNLGILTALFLVSRKVAGGTLILTSSVFCLTLLVQKWSLKRIIATVLTFGLVLWVFRVELWHYYEAVVHVPKDGVDSSSIWPTYHWWDELSEIGKAVPVMGTGLGSYQSIVNAKILPEFAESLSGYNTSLLALIGEGGVLTSSLALLFAVVVTVKCWWRIRKRRDYFAVYMGVGALAGMSSLLLLTILGYNLYRGFLLLYFFLLCGVLVSAGYNRLSITIQETQLPMGNRYWKPFLTTLGGVFSCVIIWGNGGALLAEREYSTTGSISLDRQILKKDLLLATEKYERAVKYDPLEPQYAFVLAKALEMYDISDEALIYFKKAFLLNPLDSVYLQHLVMRLPGVKQESLRKLLDQSFARSSDDRQAALHYADLLIKSGNREDAIAVLSREMVENSEQRYGIALLMKRHSFTLEEVAKVLPDSVDSWTHYGRYLAGIGDIESAGVLLEKGLEFLAKEERVDQDWFLAVFNIYQKNNREHDGVEVLQRGLKYLPEASSLRLLLLKVYQEQGELEKAKSLIEEGTGL